MLPKRQNVSDLLAIQTLSEYILLFLWADPIRSFDTTASRQRLLDFSPQVRRPLRTTYSSIFTTR